MTEPNGVIALRLANLEHRTDDYEQTAQAVVKHEEQINGSGGIVKQVATVSDEVRSLRKALYTFALGLPIAGITFLLGVLALVQP